MSAAGFQESHYKTSWEIYKAHSEAYQDDFEYYYSFCEGRGSLELFAGYGCLTNYLVRRGIVLEAVDIEPNFAKSDFSKRAEKKGKWIDLYQDGECSFQHEYHTRIYEEGDFEQLLIHTHLRLVGIFYNYGNPKEEVMEPGWVEYVLEKS